MSTTIAALTPMVAQFLQTFEQEHQTTMKVLRALPADKLDFKPHERNPSARELAWHIGTTQLSLARFLVTGKFDGQWPAPPAAVDEIAAGCENYYQQMRETLSGLTQEQISATLDLPGGHRVPASAILWMNLFHQIHHRGQLSVYVRMMGGKVPSIYGPSGDENPFV